MSGSVRRQVDRPIAGHERRTVTVCGLLLAAATQRLTLDATRRRLVRAAIAGSVKS